MCTLLVARSFCILNECLGRSFTVESLFCIGSVLMGCFNQSSILSCVHWHRETSGFATLCNPVPVKPSKAHNFIQPRHFMPIMEVTKSFQLHNSMWFTLPYLDVHDYDVQNQINLTFNCCLLCQIHCKLYFPWKHLYFSKAFEAEILFFVRK